MPDKITRWLLFLIPLFLVLTFTKKDVGGPNDAARIATIQAMVEQHTMSLENTILKSDVDIMMRNGHRYSDKPPLLQGLGALIYWPLYQAGIQFSTHYKLVYFLLTFILAGIPYVILCGLMFILIKKLTESLLAAWAGWGIMLAGTILFPYAMTFNNHILAALMIFMAIGFYLCLDSEKENNKLIGWIGFCAAAGMFLELPTGGLNFLGLGILLGMKNPRRLLYYLAGAILPAVAHFSLNYWQAGDFIPAYLHKEFYQFQGAYWGGELGKKRLFGKTIFSQFWHMTLGYRGIFLFSPILLGGLWEMVRYSFRKKDTLQGVAILGIVLLLGTMASYALQISDLGGGSYGLRWVIPALPILLVFTALWFSRLKSKAGMAGGICLFIPAVIISSLGVYNPWPQNAVTPVPFLENIVYMTFNSETDSNPLADMIIEKTSLDKGLAYYELGREAWNHNYGYTAISYMNKSLLYDPHHSLTYYQLGMLYDMAGMPEKAIPVYQKLLQLEPENAGACHNFAIALDHAGQYEEAVKMYRKALELEPDRVNSLAGLAETLFLMHRYSEASVEIQKAMKIAPDSKAIQQIYTQINQAQKQ
jgi:predicted TPR repeat methyltransferase